MNQGKEKEQLGKFNNNKEISKFGTQNNHQRERRSFQSKVSKRKQIKELSVIYIKVVAHRI